MKWLDEVRVIVSKKKYKDKGVKCGQIGTILMPEIRDNAFYVNFCDENGKDVTSFPIKVFDLETIKSSNITDEDILEELPKKDPKWWCEVENGFIINLKGEKKNKIPFDYK